jgi:hypothetical protein
LILPVRTSWDDLIGRRANDARRTEWVDDQVRRERETAV